MKKGGGGRCCFRVDEGKGKTYHCSPRKDGGKTSRFTEISQVAAEKKRPRRD